MLDTAHAIAALEKHGVLLQSARGPVPSLVEMIAEEPITGSWWGHPAGKHIFSVLGELEDANVSLVCRLVDNKVTHVHRRLWAALTRTAARVPLERLASIREVHTATGAHQKVITPFLEWYQPVGGGDTATEQDVAWLVSLAGAHQRPPPARVGRSAALPKARRKR